MRERGGEIKKDGKREKEKRKERNYVIYLLKDRERVSY